MHLMNADSLGLWAVHSPALPSELGNELPMEAGISRWAAREQNASAVLASSSTSLLRCSSPRVARGNTAAASRMSRAQSSPLLVSEGAGAVNYLHICHQVGRGGEASALPDAAECAEAFECSPVGRGNRVLMTGTMDPRDESTFTSSGQARPGTSGTERAFTPNSAPNCTPSSAGGSRPGSQASSRAMRNASSRSAGRRGMPLSACSAPKAAGGSVPGNHLFGLVSRSHNFSQGSPTELGHALASVARPSSSAGSQAQAARLKQATNVRSSSSASRISSGARPCPAVALSGPGGNSSSVSALRGMPLGA